MRQYKLLKLSKIQSYCFIILLQGGGPLQGPKTGLLSNTRKWIVWGDTCADWDWHPDHSGYSGASLPANGPDPDAATGTLLSLVSSWRRQLARVPRPVRNKRLYWPLPFPLFFLSLALPILPVFLVPPSWTQESGRRASAWAEDWRLITSSWQRTQIFWSGFW